MTPHSPRPWPCCIVPCTSPAQLMQASHAASLPLGDPLHQHRPGSQPALYEALVDRLPRPGVRQAQRLQLQSYGPCCQDVSPVILLAPPFLPIPHDKPPSATCGKGLPPPQPGPSQPGSDVSLPDPSGKLPATLRSLPSSRERREAMAGGAGSWEHSGAGVGIWVRGSLSRLGKLQLLRGAPASLGAGWAVFSGCSPGSLVLAARLSRAQRLQLWDPAQPRV